MVKNKLKNDKKKHRWLANVFRMIPKITEHSPKDLSNVERPRPSSKKYIFDAPNDQNSSLINDTVIFWLFFRLPKWYWEKVRFSIFLGGWWFFSEFFTFFRGWWYLCGVKKSKTPTPNILQFLDIYILKKGIGN